MGWIDTVVVTVVIAVGLVILYRALQEPLDLLGGLIKRGFDAARDKIAGPVYQGGYDSITYQ